MVPLELLITAYQMGQTAREKDYYKPIQDKPFWDLLKPYDDIDRWVLRDAWYDGLEGIIEMYFVHYDDAPKKLVEAKIDEAVLRYKQRYGHAPRVCMVNPEQQPTGMLLTNAKILPTQKVPVNYFWVGNE
jgi:hypothetical protein